MYMFVTFGAWLLLLGFISIVRRSWLLSYVTEGYELGSARPWKFCICSIS